MADTQVERIMRSLGVTEAEAKTILAEDKAIDRGERMDFDLSPEAEKEAKKMANVGTRKTASEPVERKRKENFTKANVISEVAKFLENLGENVQITNKERQIAFSIGSEDYEFTLVQKRKPKK
jgi:hypothetical protein